MKILMKNKETEQEVIYTNAHGYDVQGMIYGENEYESVIQIVFGDGHIVAFKESEWDLFVL